MSEYGSHTYTAKYTITNFVSETSDAQMIYWTLIPYEFSSSIGNAYVKIYTDFDIADTTDVWGYGNYGGTAYVYDGYIEMQSDGTLETKEYMTILVKFPLETFNTTNKLDYDFEHYYNMAEEGANKYKNSISGDIVVAVIEVVMAVIGVFFSVIGAVYSCKLGGVSNFAKGLNYGIEGKKIPKDVPYFRDIPCKKDIYRAYNIGYQYNIIKGKTDILGAIILKWIKDGIIRIEEKETGVIFKKENTVLTETGGLDIDRLSHFYIRSAGTNSCRHKILYG